MMMENGWRYFGTDSSGNKLLISTGVPLMLNGSSTVEGGRNKWWDLTKNVEKQWSQFNYGLYNNFEKIPCVQTTSGTDVGTCNTAIGRFEARKKKYNNVEYDAIGDYFESSAYKNKIMGVRTLTLEEYLYATRWKLWARWGGQG